MEEHLELLNKYKFKKQLEKLNKKLKNKKIIIYGAGLFFKSIKENYDLSNLNIIGISDRKYLLEDEGKEEFGYKVVPFDKIVDYKPDYILISVMNYMPILKSFRNKEFNSTKIKVYPLVDKPFFELLSEVL